MFLGGVLRGDTCRRGLPADVRITGRCPRGNRLCGWRRLRRRLRPRRGRRRLGSRRRGVRRGRRTASGRRCGLLLLVDLWCGIPLVAGGVAPVDRVVTDLLGELGQLRGLLAALRRLVALRDSRGVVLVTAVHAVTLDDLAVAAVPGLEDEAGLVAVAGGRGAVALHRVARVHPVLLDEGELTVGVGVPAEDLACQLQTLLVGTVVKLRHLGGDIGRLGLLDARLVGLRDQQRGVTEVPLDAVPRHIARGSPHAGSERPGRLLASAVAVELGGGQVDAEVGVDALLGDRGDPLEVGDHQTDELLCLGSDGLLLGERRCRAGRR